MVLVGAGRFELPTPCSRSKCATRLRYAPPDRKHGPAEVPNRPESRSFGHLSLLCSSLRDIGGACMPSYRGADLAVQNATSTQPCLAVYRRAALPLKADVPRAQRHVGVGPILLQKWAGSGVGAVACRFSNAAAPCLAAGPMGATPDASDSTDATHAYATHVAVLSGG